MIQALQVAIHLSVFDSFHSQTLTVLLLVIENKIVMSGMTPMSYC